MGTEESNRSVRFFPNAQPESALEVTSEAHNEKYLGLLVYMGKSKVQTFNYLKV